jgi:HEAT repeat protein
MKPQNLLLLLLLPGLLLAADPAITELVGQLPANDAKTSEAAYTRVLKAGSSALDAVCAMIVPPGSGDDSKARFLLSGLAFHVVRPGAEADRKLYAAAILKALSGAKDRETRAFFIRQLRWAGGTESVAPLGRYLRDPSLCEAATFSLLTMRAPGTAGLFVAALRTADNKTEGTLIRALGELRCGKARADIMKRVLGGDPTTRMLAVHALAQIGDPDDRSLLMGNIGGMAGNGYAASALTADRLLYARRLAEGGHTRDAAAICRSLASGKSIAGTRCAALSSLAAIAPEEASADLMAGLGDPEAAVRAVAQRLLVETPGTKVTQSIMAALGKASGAARVAAIELLGLRRDAVALTSLAPLVKDGDAGVRHAAIGACGRIGGIAAAAAVLPLLSAGDKDDAEGACEALTAMTGDGVNGALAAAVQKVDPATAAALIDLLGDRRASDQADAVATWLTAKDKGVRRAAAKTLGAIGSPAQLPRLIDGLLASDSKSEQSALGKTVTAIGRRIPDAEKRAAAVLTALGRAGAPQKPVLVAFLGKLGGSKALKEAVAASKSADSTLRDAAVRALASWTDMAAFDALLTIAGDGGSVTHKVLAVRGCVRLLGEAELPGPEKLRRFDDVLAAAGRPDEKKLVISGVAAVGGRKALAWIERHLDDPALSKEAAAAVAQVAAPADAKSLATVKNLPQLKKASALLGSGDAKNRLDAAIAALPDPNNPNVAQGRPVKTSCGSQGGNRPEKAVDGKTGRESGWWGVKYPSWWQVDLQEVVTIDKVNVFFYWDGSRYYQYKVQTSLDAKSWQTVADLSAATDPAKPQGREHRFAPTKARYVCVKINKNSANEAVHLLEVRVFRAGVKK